MPTNANIPPTRDEVIAEIASILAQGCLRLRKSRGISPESGNEAGKDKYSRCLRRIDLIVRATEAFMNERVNAPRRRGGGTARQRVSP